MPSVDRLQPRAQYCRSQQHYHRSPGVTAIPISMQMYANVIIRLTGFDPHSISGASLIIRKQRLRSPTACSEMCERRAWCRGKSTPSTWMIIRLFNTILSCESKHFTPAIRKPDLLNDLCSENSTFFCCNYFPAKTKAHASSLKPFLRGRLFDIYFWPDFVVSDRVSVFVSLWPKEDVLAKNLYWNLRG